MQPLERYLSNLSKLLPADQRDDIIRELSEDIQSEMDEKREELGRPLTDEEQYALLKRRGNPMQVAAGYAQNQGTFSFGRQWIGPVLFPFYVRVLRFNLGLTFLILGGIFLALQLSGQRVGFSQIFSNVLLQLFVQMTAVTVIFSLVERHFSRHPHHWDQEKFKIDLQLRIKSDIGKKMREISRFDSISILIASSVALLWMQSLWAQPFLIFGPAASLIQFAPVWHRVYPVIVLIMVTVIVRAAINLARPDWVRFRDFVALLVDAAALAVVYTLMFAHTLVVPADAAASSSQHVASIVNQWAPYAMFASAVIALGQTIHDLIRLYKNWRWASSPSPQQ